MTVPFRLLSPGHIGVTGSHEVSPGSNHFLSVFCSGEDQEMAGPTAHVMDQLSKALLVTGKEKGDSR